VPTRRERPAKAALTREGIIDAAQEVLDGDGFEKLTMRRLAQDLDTGPASLYVYVRSMSEVHARLIDRLLGELDLTWSGRGSWRNRLRRLLLDYVAVLLRHPGLARAAIATWPDGPHYLDLVELVLRLLTAGGVPLRRAAWGVDVLLQQATAMAAEYGTRSEEDEHHGLEQLGRAFEGASPERYPLLASLGYAGMVDVKDWTRPDWAVDALIAGVAATPRPGE
jgi:AcrR family transcriptional regulator